MKARHINIRFHALRHEADFFFTKQLPTPLYEQARRDLDANESIATKARMKSKQPRDLSGSRSNLSGQKHPISEAKSAEKRETKPMSNTL